MTKICVQCGKEFTPHPGAELIQKYCSKQCKRDFAKKPKELRDMVAPADSFVNLCIDQTPATAPPLYERNCLCCRRRFKQTFHNEKFCSDDCRLDYFQMR